MSRAPSWNALIEYLEINYIGILPLRKLTIVDLLPLFVKTYDSVHSAIGMDSAAVTAK
jgi:hypothetical protein